MVKLKSRINGSIIEVPGEHWHNVLQRQGQYILITEPKEEPKQEPVVVSEEEEMEEPAIKRKPGRPKKITKESEE